MSQNLGGHSSDAETDTRSACSQEQIHIPGAIQPHGVFLALDPARDLAVVAASRNAAGLLAASGSMQDVLGRGIDGLIGAEFGREVRQRLSAGELPGKSPWQSTLRLDAGRETYDAAVYAHGGLVHMDMEPVGPADEADALSSMRQLQCSLVELREAQGGLDELARVMTRSVRLLTGYERVLIYRFNADWTGESMGEDKVDDWGQSLNGLRSPASNIPAQARALYRHSPMRWVADWDATPMPLELDPAWTRGQPTPQALDLTFSHLRSLSPNHLQLHRSMGVNGSLSLSVIHEHRLWGLVICHHRRPHRPSPGQRAAVAALTNAFALRIGLAEHAAMEQARSGDLGRLSVLLADMAQAEAVTPALTTGATIGGLFEATGAAVVYDGAITLLGRTPPEADVRGLAGWLQARSRTAKLFRTDNLAAAYPPWAGHTATASGLLAVFLSADRPDMLLWFRPEERQLVNWGGNPNKGVIDAASALPQLYFERWVEERHGIARPWAAWELKIAETLRHGITEVIVRSLRRIAESDVRLHQSQTMAAESQAKAAEEALRRSNEVLEERVQAQQVQHEIEARFRFATQSGRLGVWELDLRTYELTASEVCKDNFGYGPEATFTYAAMRDAVHPEDRDRMMAAVEHSLATGAKYDILYRIVRPGGATGWVQVHAQVVQAADGTAFRMAGISLDVTERVLTEERMRQSQRVEAVGRLTAGVAHDFNNVLQALLGGLELAIDGAHDRPSIQAELDLALQAGQRGARLTSRLLSFSRQQDLRPTALDLSPLLKDLSRTLKRTLGHTITVCIEMEAVPRVLADVAHLDSALLNLAINARDAMPKGGTLRIEAFAADGQVVIAVTDTGEGMTPEVLAHACEPFFSTKGMKGSGLGLSMVHGFARQSGGELRIQSTLGQGTRMELCLPIAHQPVVLAPVAKVPKIRGQGRVLVVDDDVDVGRITAVFLSTAGFDVVAVSNGNAALASLGANAAFDALVADYAMPGINGVDLVLEVRELHPVMPALIITGYNGAEDLARLPSDVVTLSKPFQREDLVRSVKKMIEDTTPAPQPGAGRIKSA